jgi:hypothetical protein
VLLNAGGSIGVTQQPANQSVLQGQTANFNVGATGALSYRWRRNGVGLHDGGRISGSGTHALTIAACVPADCGVYDVLMVPACDIGALSTPASLSVTSAPSTCPADLNGDHVVDDADFQIFVQAYNALLCPP